MNVKGNNKKNNIFSEEEYNERNEMNQIYTGAIKAKL